MSIEYSLIGLFWFFIGLKTYYDIQIRWRNERK